MTSNIESQPRAPRSLGFPGIRANESGFSMIEALISVVIVSVGILGYGMVSGSLMEKNSVSKKSTIAATLAQAKVEELRNLALTTVLTVGTSTETVDEEGDTDAAVTLYTRSWTVAADPATNVYYLFDVDVTVSWTDKLTRSVTLYSKISQ